ncbi:unnamed protein product [Schistocephalus solidus]|uniref:Protein arginine methyltransferase NDUFAF7 n=1 Tax=Schistocephalus solidus TaxID=70667 RepID=A0A183TGT4_SCHSO|nr:unnamed protein product [Schistocephalus solidus]
MRLLSPVTFLNTKGFRICTSSNAQSKPDLMSFICRQIRSSGPISVSDYMKLALHHPIYAISKFPKVASEFQKLHLVERSDRLRAVQQSTLGPLLDALKLSPAIHWHSSLDEIPRGQCSYYLAHEFFDALPIHRFQLAGDLENRNCVEVCPEAGAILQKIAQRVADDGGAALVVDYGHVGESGDTLRAFKNHELHDPLKDPGQADITADVDFAFLRRSVEATNTPVVVHGPVTQAYFLVHMGFMARLKVLVHKCHLEEDKKNLIASSEMLLGSDKMGKRFKFMAILPRSDSADQSYVPAGFFPTWPSASTIQPSSASKT